MNVTALENFLFLPSLETNSGGTLYELQQSNGFEKDSFVIVPYKNPQAYIIEPKYFKVKNKTTIELPSKKEKDISQIILKAKTSKENYIRKVKALKSEIQQGNIYEINYCIQFSTQHSEIDPIAIFLKLNDLSKAPYSALVKLGDEFIISASPELFLEKKGNIILTKPIKGTSRRGKTIEEDNVLKHNLQTSLKERTENVMAVDVARNDLSHFAKKGTVQVNKLYNIETFETVHQMVSTVSCEIKEKISFDEILNATFPMASMTGAPKLRAMKLIDEFEDFERRYYSGAMGLVDENADFKLSVVIRSIFYNQKTHALSIAVGGAITYLSDPEKEYEECLLKANALLNVLNATLAE